MPRTAGTTGCAPAVTTRGAVPPSSGSPCPRRRRTTSTPFLTCAAPSRCTTSGNRSAAGPARSSHRRHSSASRARPRRAPARSRRQSPGRRRARGRERGSNQARHLRRRDLLGSLIAMPELAARGDGDELARFRRLVSVTIAATLVLILIGGIVRVSDSGLGWFRRQRHAWLAAVRGRRPARSLGGVGDRVHPSRRAPAVLIAVLAWRALRRLRSDTWLVRGIAAGVLVLLQAALGGLTVEKGLEEELVAAHLGLAMLLLGILIALRRAADPDARSRRRPRRYAACAPRPPSRGCWSWQRSSPGATSPGPRRRDTRTNPPSARRTWRAEPAIRPTRSRPATASSRASARAGSPTSSSSTARSCTWPRLRCWRWRRSRSSDEPRAVRSGSQRCCCWRRSPLGSSTSGRASTPA